MDDPLLLQSLYDEAAAEDRLLAQIGIVHYVNLLENEEADFK
jgi:hypothetical protein